MMFRYLPAALLVFLLSACGGGGGGGGGGGVSLPGTSAGAAPATDPALFFTPATVSASWVAGDSRSVMVSASVKRPSDFDGGTVYAYVVDTTGVILPKVGISALNALTYTVILQTSPNLAAGEYKGNFTVNLCRDSACTKHYPGSPMLLPYDFQVTAATQPFIAASAGQLAVSGYVGGGDLPTATIAVNANEHWTATSDVSWARLNSIGGYGNDTVTVSYDLTGLKQGTYNGTLTFVKDSGYTSTLPVSLQVLGSVFHFDQSLITFNAINGAPIDPRAIQIAYEGGAADTWSAASDVSWMTVNPASGTAPGQATLAIASNNQLASGTYSGNLTLRSPQNATRTIPIQLGLTPATLSLSSTSLTLGGALGRDFSPQSVTLGLNTQTNAWPWKLGTLPAWVTAGATSGAVSQSGSRLTFTAKPDSAAVGTTSVAVNVTATVNGDTLSAPIALTINKDQHKILPSEAGVALVSTPQWSRLTRTLTINDNFGANGAWSAQSNQPWLSAQPSGSQLLLTADPSSLAQDTIHYATVTLSSALPGVTAPEPIRVALWKGTAAPAAITTLKPTQYSQLTADPIRPLVYAHTGGATIDVYNVYTGARVASTSALGTALGDMVASPNGDSLYVLDTANRNVIKVDLSSLGKSATWPLPNPVDITTRLLPIRPNGVGILLVSTGTALATSDGHVLSATAIASGAMAASRDGKKVYVIDQGGTPALLGGYSVDYSAMAGGTLFTASTASAGFEAAGQNGQDVATSADGTRVYNASGWPSHCTAFQGSDLSVIGALSGGDTYPNNVEVGSDGRVYCGINGIFFSASDVWIYGADGALQKTFKFAGSGKGLLSRQMVVSGDGMILVALTNDPMMAIVPVGP
jgi:hypothetical protein